MRRNDESGASATDLSFNADEVAQRVREAKRGKGDLISFSTLFELNTGARFALKNEDLAALDPDQYFSAFLAHVTRVAPELDPALVDRIFCQYYGLQVPAQQKYGLRSYDGEVLLVELDGPSRGLVQVQLLPHVRKLRTRRLRLGKLTERDQALSRALSGGLRDHFLCMRNDDFVAQLATELESALGR
jgi:hypothetical protein